MDWMNLLSLFSLSVGLAMDSAAASAARGLAARRILWRDVGAIAFAFGMAQSAMASAGWWLGHAFGPLLTRWDHWIAFLLLAGIGGKMIHDASKEDGEGGEEGEPLRFRLLLVLALATSIDSFAAGVALPLLEAPFFLSVGMIGVTTAALSAAGVWAGRRFGVLLGKRLDVFGGVVLIALGCKILVEHLLGGT